MNLFFEEKKVQYNSNLENCNRNSPNKYTYNYTFDIKYEVLLPIITDIQMISQLIKQIRNHQLSDLILINGDNSYSIGSRFYFNYRVMIDFYVKVIDFIKKDKYVQIKYNIYKTKPISKNFFVTLSLFNENENSSKLEIEIILIDNTIIYQKILDIIYNEFNYNFLYLSQAIKKQKQNSFSYNSAIINHEFYILSQIMQNVKLIEYIINGKFEKITNEEKEEINPLERNDKYFNDNKDKFLHLNEIYKVILNKKKQVKDWISLNNVNLKIHLLRTRGDKLVIQFKVLTNSNKENNEIDNINNIITVIVRKLTENSSFVLIKYGWDFDVPENVILEVKKLLKKSLEKIKKLCETAKDKYNF